MKTYRLLPFLFLLFASTLLSGCKDDDNAQPTKEEMITAHSWQGDKVETNPLLAGNLPDIKTMVLTFNRTGTYTATYTNNGQTVPLAGEWEFRNEETSLYFDLLTTLGQTYNIEIDDEVTLTELTPTSLVLSTQATVPFLGRIPIAVYFVPKE